MKKTKRILALLMALCMALACLTACGGGNTEVKDDDEQKTDTKPTDNKPQDAGKQDEAGEKILTTAVTAAWDNMNPHKVTFDIGNFIMFMMYEPLMLVDMQGNVIPRLASAWERSSDGKTITFHLAEDANWTDGTPVTADDVVFTFKMLSNKDYNSRSVYMTYVAGTDNSGYELSPGSIEAVAKNDKTVEITLKDAVDDSILFTNFKRVWIIPEHIFGDINPADIGESELWSNDPVTSGPFIYDTQISGEQMELVANPDFYLGRPKTDRIVVKVMTSSAMAAALVAGELDFTAGSNIAALNYADYDTLTGDSSLNVEPVQAYSFQYLACDWNEYPDVRVRKALSLAIDRQAIIDNVLLGNGEPLLTQYTSTSDYYLPELYEDGKAGYDPEKAKALLDEAGWDYGREITLYYHTGNEMREQTCLMIQQQWQAVGLKVSLQAQDTSSMMAGLSSGEFHIGTMGQSGDNTAYNYADLYMPGHPVVDMSHLSTTYFFDTMTEMKFMTSKDEVVAKCAEVQQEMLEQMPYIYLYSPYTLQACSNRISGYVMADANAYCWPAEQWDIA